jgi:hypothetical protein
MKIPMKVVELTNVEAHLISEFFEATAYPGLQKQAIRDVASACGVLEEVGAEGLGEALEAIFQKTR